MRRVLIGIAVAAVVALAAVPTASADEGPSLNFEPQLAKEACGPGTLLVDVEQKVVNDADSGVVGNVWAFDSYERRIQVFQTGSGTFCATASYEGEFTTNAGPSPGGTGTVAAGITGELEGGYRTTQFSGTFAPTAQTKGDLGTFDYACDLSFNCPGYVSWPSLYFSSTSGFDLAWWGWIYQTEHNGTG